MLQTACSTCLKYYQQNGEIQTKIKNDNSPVTAADEAVNNIICNYLQNNVFLVFKNLDASLCIISEELQDCLIQNKDAKDKITFFVDPIDGTRDFIKKSKHFTINIGICINKKPIIGFIVAPAYNTCYVGVVKHFSYKKFIDYKSLHKFTGAKLCNNFMDIKKLDLSNFATISPSNKTSKLVLAISKNSKEADIVEKLKKNLDIKDILLVSSSLKGCMITNGDADIYYRYGQTCEWDTAAMHAIARSCGCVIKNIDDTDLKYEKHKKNFKNTKGFCIVNKKQNFVKLV